MISYYDDDPGPCPVCDAPHTTCVGPASSSGRTTTVPIKRPNGLPIPGPVAPLPDPPPFTTGEYQRTTHGPARKRRRVNP